MGSYGLTGRLNFDNREVHLWTVQLDTSDHSYEHCSSWLSADETARAERFKFDRHRRRYVIGRGVLRARGRILGEPAARIQFAYGDKGKPSWANSNSPVRFNVSNSGDLAAYAFTKACEIGVDIEQLRAMSDMQDVARRFFAREEVQDLMSLPESERTHGFFHCWTRNESYIKAIGDGLSVPLDSFRVTLLPGDTARMVHLGGSVDAAACWTLHGFDPFPDYIGALAYPDAQRPIVSHGLLRADELLDSLEP
jgi:4'-phosphopantetheinyl transferase